MRGMLKGYGWKLFFLILGCGIVLNSVFLVGKDLSFGGERMLPIYSVDTTEKKVAISFDAAWGNEFTAGILDILDTYNVKTTFFLVAFWAEKYPDDVCEIYNRGHDLGNHSSTHPDMACLSAAQVATELNGTADIIEKLTGVRPVLFRPPYGSYSNTLISESERLGYKVIQWSVDSLDWKNISAQQIVERVTRNVENGSIVLFHNNAHHVLEYLPQIIEKLQADGFQIVKLNELIYHDNYEIDHTGKQISKGGNTKSDGQSSGEAKEKNRTRLGDFMVRMGEMKWRQDGKRIA